MGKNLVVLERNLLLANYNQNLKFTLWICLNSPRWNDNLKKMNKRKKGEIAENGYECLLWATGNFSLERKSRRQYRTCALLLSQARVKCM